MSDTNTIVTVTGASGFVGSWIVCQLLEKGYRVRGTVRGAPDAEKYAFLRDLDGADEGLELVQGELLTAGSYDEAMEGADYCIHTASPYALDVDDPKTDLVDPAVQGTKNVLEAAKKGGVRRVVLTSSMAAITDEPGGDEVLTEEVWNEKSSLGRNPYYYSKTMAERAAWDFAEDCETFDLVVINPFLIVGPSLTPSLNTSNEIFVNLLDGEFPGIIRLTWGMVDVRDVARAHILAMENDGASGRHLCVHHSIDMRELVELLHELGYGDDYSLPGLNLANPIGDFAVKLFSYFESAGTGSYLRTHVGRVPRFDDSKIRAELGLEYLPLQETIGDTLADLKHHGHLPG